MQVLNEFMFRDGGLIVVIVVAVFAAVVALVMREHRARERRTLEDKMLAATRPCSHRFVRMVFKADPDGKVKERYPQCADCGERVLMKVVFNMEED